MVVGGAVCSFFFFFLVTEKNRTVHCPAEAASTLLLPGLILHGPAFQEAARPALWAGRRPAPELWRMSCSGDGGSRGACTGPLLLLRSPLAGAGAGSGSPPGYRTAAQQSPARALAVGVVVVQHAGVPVRALRVVQFEAVTPLWLRGRERGLRQVLLLLVAVSGVLLRSRRLPGPGPLQLLGSRTSLWLGLKDSGPDGTYFPPELR